MKRLIIGVVLVVLMLVPAACDDDSPVSFFPVQKSGFDQMAAMMGGRLELVDGYLRAADFNSDSSYLVIWPPGFSLCTEGDEIQVVDADDLVVATLGETIFAGGGEGASVGIVEKYIGRSLPEGCTGPFWIASEVESPAVTFFPLQRAGFDQMTALMEGRLELVDGYLRLVDAHSSYLAIWPPGFFWRTEGDEIQVLNGDDEVVAIVGEAIKVGGGETTADVVEMYIGRSLLDDCTGPYWIVSEVISD